MSWPKVRLGDVGTLIRGKGIKRSETCATGKPCIRYGEIYTSFNVFLDKPRSFVDDALFDDCPHIKKGDLVLTLTGENKEEIAKTLCYLGDEEIAAGGDLAIWSGHGCDPKYLAYLMYSPAMIKAKADASNGHIVVHASVKKLQDIELPLPPLAEQKKIVEKVEKALRRVDALKAQFERMEMSAADYFKAALAETFAAVKGEKVKLGDVCEIAYGYTAKSRCDDGNGDPKYLRITDIQDDSVDWSRVPVCQCDDIRSYLLAQGDIVFARTGATTGKSFLLEGDFPKSVYASYLIRVKLRNKRIVPQYLRWYFDTESYWSVIRCGMAGAAQGGFNSKKLAALEIPVPSVEEQIRIDQIMRQAKVKKENLIYFARRCIGICGKMRKAILAEAFQ